MQNNQTAQWETIIRESEERSKTCQIQPKPLEVLSKPNPVSDPRTREVAKIDKTLLAVFRKCSAGEIHWPLFLEGKPGTGKSSAVLAFADWIAYSAYFQFCDLIHAFRQIATKGETLVTRWIQRGDWSDNDQPGKIAWSIEKDTMGEDEFLKYLSSVDLLVIDDLGTRGTASDFVYDSLLTTMNLRAEKPLIVTSNLDLQGIADTFDERIVSRLYPGTRFVLKGPDRRFPKT